MSTTEDIVSAFAEGKVFGLGSAPEHIKTQISHVFLYQDRVYKLYRKDNEGFNKYFVDLADTDLREQFYRDDFFTNHYFNPEVYLNLLRLKQNGDNFLLTSSNEQRDDLVIEMKRIDPTYNLTEILKSGKLTSNEAEEMGHFMTKAIAEFPEKPDSKLNYHEIMLHFMEDLRGFSYMADPEISKEDTDKVMELLSRHVMSKKEVHSKMTAQDMVISIDNHADNVFYKNGQTSFIDVYLPKESWRTVEPLYCIYRPATDVAVWEGEEVKNSIVEGYRRFYGVKEIDKATDLFYQIYFALIRAAGFYQLYKEHGTHKEEADKYWHFISEALPRLEKSL